MAWFGEIVHLGISLTVALFVRPHLRVVRPLAAIKTVIRDKSTKALPFAMTLATFANCSLWFGYVFGWRIARLPIFASSLRITCYSSLCG